MVCVRSLRRLLLGFLLGAIGLVGSYLYTPIVEPAQGHLIADLGFRPEVNGFAFENYGNENRITNLTPIEMQQMFGDPVCVSPGKPCTLTPVAQRWMEATNQEMNDGHCEGMAVLSLILYTEKARLVEMGVARTLDLTLQENPALQREIAYWYATQATKPTVTSEILDRTPNEILDILVEALKPGIATAETYTMGIYKPGLKAGHSITPYAVMNRGGGRYVVLVYDNNHPGMEQGVTIDRNTNTWHYLASTKPGEPLSPYYGSASSKTLTLTPTAPRFRQQVCDFCRAG